MSLQSLRRPASWVAQIAAGLILPVLIAVIWTEQRMLACHTPETAAEVDAAIILGGGMGPDRQLNHLGRRRVETGKSLLDAGRARLLIFTGAIRGDPELSEARLMHEYALTLGIDPSLMRVEPDALTTLQNLRFSLAIARGEGLLSFAIVTDAFHLRRAGMLARLLGISRPVLVASPGLTEDRRGKRAALLWRETLAWWFNAGKAVAWTGLMLLGLSEEERAEWIV